MNSLIFEFSESTETNDHEVRVLVDGVDLLKPDRDNLIGLDPPIFFRQRALLSGGDIFVGRCSCGEVGCNNRQITVEVTESTVLWRGNSGVVAEFCLSEYSEIIDRAARDTGWESIERAAERLAESVDFSSLIEIGYVFEWASARMGKGKIVLSFLRNGQQSTFDVGWDSRSPEDARKQVSRWVRERDA